jgi:hypothetical protein
VQLATLLMWKETVLPLSNTPRALLDDGMICDNVDRSSTYLRMRPCISGR